MYPNSRFVLEKKFRDFLTRKTEKTELNIFIPVKSLF